MSQIYFSKFITNAGSENLNVNGSLTPVTFGLDLSAYESITVAKLNLYLEIGGNITSYNDFMSISALTNGLTFEVQSQGESYVSGSIKNNRDILRFCNHDFKYRKRNTDSSFGNTNTFTGTREIAPASIVVSNRTNDFIRMTVRDNLSAFTAISIEVEGSSI